HFVRESLAGLSLLRDVPNHRHSMPTKVLEYAAVGTPVVTTALPLAADVVTQGPAGTVIPFGSVDAVAEVAADAVLRLDADPELVQRYGAQGYSTVERAFNWNHDSQAFLRVLQGS
ncbi:MAG: glycosyltransferase, partial [Actinobacteria bacterium]|nr:glycosyltransferase [Actinomycetota bacterium]